MKVDLYRTNHRKTILVIPHGTEPETVTSDTLPTLGEVQGTKNVELEAISLLGGNPGVIRTDLQAQGYSVAKVGWEFNLPSPVERFDTSKQSRGRTGRA